MNFHLAWSPTMIIVVFVGILLAGFIYRKKFDKSAPHTVKVTGIALIVMGFLAVHVGTPQSELGRESFDKDRVKTPSAFVENDRLSRDDAQELLENNVNKTVDKVEGI